MCVLFKFAEEGDLELVSDKQQLATQSESVSQSETDLIKVSHSESVGRVCGRVCGGGWVSIINKTYGGHLLADMFLQ